MESMEYRENGMQTEIAAMLSDLLSTNPVLILCQPCAGYWFHTSPLLALH